MATTTVETVYAPDNIDGKRYLQNQRWRLRIWMCSGIAMLAVLSTALALIILILNFSTFLSQTYELAEGDMRLISVSTAFCEEISLGKDALKRKLWILPSSRRSPQLRRTNMSTEVFVSKFKYWYKGFYLLEGSSVVINAESDSPLKLFIFKDRKRLDEWLDNNGESTERSGISGDPDFSTQPSKISYTLSVQETGNYFILFKYAREKNDFSRMKLDLIVDRKVYDLESSVFSCSAAAQETCSARLLFGSSEVGVIEVTNEPSYLSNELKSTWRCEPRTWFYVAVFVGPILFSIIASLVFYFVFNNRSKTRHLQKLAIQRQQVLRRVSAAGCNQTDSFGYNRSLNGSLRRSPSRTPSIRSLGNQNDMSRAPSRAACLQPVVTTMYTGSISEDSGHDTDEDSKTTRKGTRPEKRTSSVDGASLASVSRRPSFSTFQGSEDESCNAMREEVEKVEAASSRKRNRQARESCDGRRPVDDRARKTPKKARSDRHEMHDKIPNGTVPRNYPTRRYSSDELYDRTIKTLPRNRGDTVPANQPSSPYAPELQLLAGRPASLPSLQYPGGAWGLPSDLAPDSRPKINSYSANSEFRRHCEENTTEHQEIKLRTQSGKRREMGWTPRLSMVSEV